MATVPVRRSFGPGDPLRGRFAMILLVRTPSAAAEVDAALAPLRSDGRLAVTVSEVADRSASEPGGPAYTLHVHGADRPGIVAGITEVVARHGANLVDLGTRLRGELYVLVAELDLPPAGDAAALAADLTNAATRLGVVVSLQPAEPDVL